MNDLIPMPDVEHVDPLERFGGQLVERQKRKRPRKPK
jgi:hypothetical protein